MNKALLWVVRFGHRSALHRLIARLAPFAERRWFPPMAGVMAFAATLSMSVPTVPLLCALVVLNRRRWRAVSFWAVLGSSAAGALLVHVLAHFGALFMEARMPELVASTHWQHLVELSSHHAWWVLLLVAASPVAQTPMLFLAAIIGMPAIAVFASLFAGKAVKYGLMAGLTALAIEEVSEVYERQPAGL